MLETHQSQLVQNKGFRVIDGQIYTYELTKTGFSYFYCKRIVSDDGIHTSPFNIKLRPLQTQHVCLSLNIPLLSPACDNPKFWFIHNGVTFKSVLHTLAVFKLYRNSANQQLSHCGMKWIKSANCQTSIHSLRSLMRLTQATNGSQTLRHCSMKLFHQDFINSRAVVHFAKHS